MLVSPSPVRSRVRLGSPPFSRGQSRRSSRCSSSATTPGTSRPTRFKQLQPVFAKRGIELTYTDKLDDLNAEDARPSTTA